MVRTGESCASEAKREGGGQWLQVLLMVRWSYCSCLESFCTWEKYEFLAFERLAVCLISVDALGDSLHMQDKLKSSTPQVLRILKQEFFLHVWLKRIWPHWIKWAQIWAELKVTVRKKEKQKKSGWEKQRGRGREGKSACWVITAILRMWLVLRKKGASDVPSDLTCSHKIYNHKGPASERKTVLKKLNL